MIAGAKPLETLALARLIETLNQRCECEAGFPEAECAEAPISRFLVALGARWRSSGLGRPSEKLAPMAYRTMKNDCAWDHAWHLWTAAS